jgi:hypothetical protein
MCQTMLTNADHPRDEPATPWAEVMPAIAQWCPNQAKLAAAKPVNPPQKGCWNLCPRPWDTNHASVPVAMVQLAIGTKIAAQNVIH